MKLVIYCESLDFYSKKRIYLGLFLLILITSCSKQEQNHPLPNLIPHAGTETVPVKKKFSKSDGIPGVFQDYLNGDATLDFQQLNVDLPNSFGTIWSKLDEDRMILFHVASTMLYEINLTHQSVNRIAKSGRGPGEISYATDIAVFDNSLYVFGQDMRVSKFDCYKSPCSFSRVIPISQSALSGDVFNDSIFILGQTPLVSGGGRSQDEFAVTSISADGDSIVKFGDTYETEFWLIKDLFQQGGVMVDESTGKVLVYYNYLPFLYVYASDFSLHQKFQITDFTNSHVHFDKELGRRQTEVRSQFSDLSHIHSDTYLLTISHNKDQRNPDGSTRYDRTYDFYVLNLTSDQTTFLGTTSLHGTYVNHYFLSNFGIFQNEGGVVSFAASDL